MITFPLKINLMKTMLLSFCYMLWMLACQTRSGDESMPQVMDSKQMAPAYEEGQAGGSGTNDAITSTTEQKIIRNGSINMKVTDALKAKSEIENILSKHNARISNEQLDNSDYQTSYHIQIRVPAANLDGLIASLEAMDATITYKSINATDVTEEYIDLETRLTNKRAYLVQYRQLLKTAKTVEDILKVREQIRVLEEEIESVEGRLKYLSSQVELSTLDVTLTQLKDYVYRPDRSTNFFERLKKSLSTGWYGFVDFCLFLLGLWPFWLVGFVLVYGYRRYRRNRKLRKAP